MTARTRAIPRRQAIRRTLLLFSFIIFPLTMNYLSPYLIIDSAFNGIVNGSLLAFGSMFIGSLILGRLWCGWACPAAGVQEPLLNVNNRRVGQWLGLVKWFIWVPWIAAIVLGIVRAGGYHAVDSLYGTVNGISVAGSADRPIFAAYIVYLLVVLVFLGLAVAFGRRGGCHVLCWMAPFMIIGRWIRNRFGWPALRLVAASASCTGCGTCTRQCPMSIDVQAKVASGSLEHSECILCGTCADGCPSKVIRYSFSSGVGEVPARQERRQGEAVGSLDMGMDGQTVMTFGGEAQANATIAAIKQ
jgi:ferredoxin-type protein NapH